MKENARFLLGHGERLAQRIAAPKSKPSKVHPYSFDEARERLLPQLVEAREEALAAPPLACPGDRTVLALTLHPAYLAKSYFPSIVLDDLGLDAIGSRRRDVVVRAWKKGGTERQAPEDGTHDALLTYQLFAAVQRTALDRI
ncbi:MAG TPA: hypothetical protein PK569_23170, partial [Thermoanaerobaculia bacterium]|nr:hypothetical protein [Thermoanaerobaculia bacterium]